MKKTKDGRYISDSVYKVFAYLYDFAEAVAPGNALKAILLVPTGVSALAGAPASRAMFVAPGDDREKFAQALKNALLA